MSEGRRRKRVCEICEAEYRPTYGGQRTCGRVCGWTLSRKLGSRPEPKPKLPPQLRTFGCPVCGIRVETISWKRKICGSRECVREYSRLHMNANYERFKDRLLEQAHRRRSQFKAQFVEDVSLRVLYDRDHGRCGICRRKVPAIGSTTRKHHPNMASIDHIVLISEGGEHSYANTRLSHYRCNLTRSNGGGGEQLALIG